MMRRQSLITVGSNGLKTGWYQNEYMRYSQYFETTVVSHLAYDESLREIAPDPMMLPPPQQLPQGQNSVYQPDQLPQPDQLLPQPDQLLPQPDQLVGEDLPPLDDFNLQDYLFDPPELLPQDQNPGGADV